MANPQIRAVYLVQVTSPIALNIAGDAKASLQLLGGIFILGDRCVPRALLLLVHLYFYVTKEQSIELTITYINIYIFIYLDIGMENIAHTKGEIS
jgi:hypothetical protein